MSQTEIILTIISIFLFVGLSISVVFNIKQYIDSKNYIKSDEHIYATEAGIIDRNIEFMPGDDYEFTYDFSSEAYSELKRKYEIENTAKDGSEFKRSMRLMHEYAPRLKHDGWYDNHIPVNALDLLAFSLDNKKHGINCRGKAQILNEMCLALGIYSRKLWIFPYSAYDCDCHVVNEIWDSSLNKWIMLDITEDMYWVDENKTPLSVLEIREKIAKREFCTPVKVGDNLDDLKKLQEKHMDIFLYIAKNTVWMQYCADNTVGECDKIYTLCPKNFRVDADYIIDIKSANKCPIVSV